MKTSRLPSRRESRWPCATFRTCASVALCVGTVLSLVNQGDVLARGMVTVLLLLKIGLNLLIQYLTSSAGVLLSVRSMKDDRRWPPRTAP